MRKIKIIAVPAGEAPLWVREAWVELEIPLDETGPNPMMRQVGALGGNANQENIGGFIVRTEIAIDILKKTNQKAADWWERNVPLAYLPHLIFGKKFCQIIM